MTLAAFEPGGRQDEQPRIVQSEAQMRESPAVLGGVARSYRTRNYEAGILRELHCRILGGPQGGAVPSIADVHESLRPLQAGMPYRSKPTPLVFRDPG